MLSMINIINVDALKAIKDDPRADKSKPYRITILVAGESNQVVQYKLALYLSFDQSKVEAAIEGLLSSCKGKID